MTARSGILAEDMAVCRALIRTGSLSFHAASRLLPRSVRDPALVLYAFCRIADDEVDEAAARPADKRSAVLRLQERLDLIYEGRPRNLPTDRAFAAVVDHHEMPRALPEALLEGLAWDALGRRYADFSGVRAYSARVASSVGAMMCVLMGVRDRDALARACDLGLAMQLTNIARDVGEDARAGRLFLPLDWLAESGIDPEAFLRNPRAGADVRAMVRRLLHEAEALYHRSEAGIARLPLSCRPGIWGARLVYAAIGEAVARNGHDSIGQRARTSARLKTLLLLRALAETSGQSVLPLQPRLHAAPAAEAAFLVDAAARHPARTSRSDTLISVMAQLKARDQGLV